MNTIWKFELSYTEARQTLRIPKDHAMLGLQVQNERPVVWAIVDSRSPETEVVVHCFVTGGEAPAPGTPELVYMGTAQLRGGAFVVHYFGEKA